MEDSLKESHFNFVDPENYHSRRRKKIGWSGQDVTAHVNNVQFACFVETARIPFLHGITSSARNLSAFLVLARLEIDILSK